MDSAYDNSPAENASESETDPDAPRMRVGGEYQASIPDLLSAEQRLADDAVNDCRDVLSPLKHWDPAARLQEQELDEYIKVARRDHSYSVEQAMGMLHYHNYSIDAALQDLVNFTPFPEEWSAEEEVMFQQAFKSHGKSFRRIQSMLTQKSIPQLVQHYYKWKKIRLQSSVIDRKSGSSSVRDDADISETEEDDDRNGPMSDSDSEFEPGKGGGRRLGKAKRTNLQPEDYPIKKRLRLPKGLFLDTSALAEIGREEEDAVASASVETNGAILEQLSSQIVNHREQIRNNKQDLSELEGQQESVEHLRQEFPTQKNTARWTDPELDIAVQCVRRYGKNFDAMSAVLGTKTASQCRNFYINHHSRLDLDRVFNEYESAQLGELANNGDSAVGSNPEEIADDALPAQSEAVDGSVKEETAWQ